MHWTGRIVAVAVATLAVGGCNPDGLVGSTATPSSAASPGGAPSAVDPASAISVLSAIPVRPIAGRDPSYRRQAYGDAWSDAGVGIGDARNGCDTRNDILRRDAKPGTVRTKPNTGGCKVTAGEWISPYSGATISRPSILDIDHIVPLGRAWAAGAKSWDAQRRLNFANDPDNLIAVDRSSNRAKGDLGPSAWRPPKAGQCAYAVRYIKATKKYELPLTSSDVAVLRDMLSTCRD
jgi:hypothetical protein